MPDKKKLSSAKKANADALESFLEREQAPKKSKKQPAKKGKLSKKTVIILLAAAAVALLIIVLVVLRSRTASYDDSASSEAQIITSVNGNSEHEVSVPTDDKGEPVQNGTGSLLSYVPAEIARIDVTNAGGTFSVLSEASDDGSVSYALEGYEDEPLQSGVADAVANDSAAIPFLEIISVHGDPQEFGLDQPRATVTIHLRDNSTATLRVGNEAAAEAGAYIGFGSSDSVFLVTDEAVDSFLYTVTDFISKAINDSPEEAGVDFNTLTISGTHFPQPITLVPNTDEALDASYMMIAPFETPANAIEASDISGNIRGLYAEEVVCVRPTAEQLGEFGLSEPYASVKAEYDDCTVVLHASAPGENGLVYLYSPDKNTVYTIQLAAVCWARTTAEALMPETVVNVKLPAVSEVTLSSGGSSYTFTVSTSTQTVTDDSGDEQTVTTVNAAYDGKALTEDNFRVFFQNLNGIKNHGAADSSSDSRLMRLTLRYSTGRSDDTVEAYTIPGDKATCLVKLNGKTVGTASKKYIDGLISDAAALSKDEEVPGR